MFGADVIHSHHVIWPFVPLIPFTLPNSVDHKAKLHSSLILWGDALDQRNDRIKKPIAKSLGGALCYIVENKQLVNSVDEHSAAIQIEF